MVLSYVDIWINWTMLNSILTFLERLTTKRVVFIFLCLGFLLYGNSLSNSFIGDDSSQVRNNIRIRSVWNIPSLFTQGTFYHGSVQQRNQDNYYRPMSSSLYSLVYVFTGVNPVGYHLVQVMVHVLNSILIFTLFRNHFGSTLSFFLGLIFLIHPINAEAVVYISALQEPLFVLFGLLALLLSMRESITLSKSIWITTFLAMSLLTKEAGVVFILIIPLFHYLYQKRNLVGGCVRSILAFLVYILLRFAVAKIYLTQDTIAPIMTLSLSSRLSHIPKLIYYYLSTFVFPANLLAFQTWTIKSISWLDFYMPLLVDTIAFVGISLLGLLVYKKHAVLFKGFIFFFLLFVIGLGIHLQLLPLDQTVSDHWFYLPMIGMLGMIGMMFKVLGDKLLMKQLKLYVLLPIAFLLLVVLSVRTVIRNSNWKDPFILYTHDLKLDRDSYMLENGLGGFYNSQKKFSEAETHYLRAKDLYPSVKTYSSLGSLFIDTGRFEEASRAYESAINYDPKHAMLWFYLAISKAKIGDKAGAIIAAKEAYLLSPGNTTLKLIRVIENDEPITIQSVSTI